jgi:hypothetical protein
MILYIFKLILKFFINHLVWSVGVRAKIYTFLLQEPDVELEKQRWTFMPANDADNVEYDSGDASLLVAFAGGALLLGGEPRIEFFNTSKRIRSALPLDRLFLIDPCQSWYLQDENFEWQGFATHERRLAQLIAARRHNATAAAAVDSKTVFIGNCMGGTASLLFSHLADYVICMIPQVDLANDRRFKFRFAAKFLPKHYNGDWILTRIKKSIMNCRGKVFVHGKDILCI